MKVWSSFYRRDIGNGFAWRFGIGRVQVAVARHQLACWIARGDNTWLTLWNTYRPTPD